MHCPLFIVRFFLVMQIECAAAVWSYLRHVIRQGLGSYSLGLFP